MSDFLITPQPRRNFLQSLSEHLSEKSDEGENASFGPLTKYVVQNDLNTHRKTSYRSMQKSVVHSLAFTGIQERENGQL